MQILLACAKTMADAEGAAATAATSAMSAASATTVMPVTSAASVPPVTPVTPVPSAASMPESPVPSEAAALSAASVTRPRFAAEASELALTAAALPVEELAALLRVDRRIAAACALRYRRFHDAEAPSTAAIAAYAGIVFKRIAAHDFSAAELAFAQGRINIVSFLYGLLRPLDGVRPYRMEGDARLLAADDRTLFAYWRPMLTDELIARTKADDGVLVDLASAEMKRMFDWRRVCREVRVVTPEFRVAAGERLRTVTVYAKMCRGEMTRYAVKHRLDDPEGLKAFAWEGFRFDAARSEGDRWMFVL